MAKKGQLKANASERSKQQRKFNGSEEQKKKRAMRNKARRQALREGRVSKGDNKDIDHKKPLRSGGSNARSNQRVRSRSANRAANGGTGGRPKGSKNKK